jgi:hypothetical protein
MTWAGEPRCAVHCRIELIPKDTGEVLQVVPVTECGVRGARQP